MSNNDLWCGNCKSHHHPVECPLEEEAMKKSPEEITINGKTYEIEKDSGGKERLATGNWSPYDVLKAIRAEREPKPEYYYCVDHKILNPCPCAEASKEDGVKKSPEEIAREIEDPYIHKGKPYERLYSFEEKRNQIISIILAERSQPDSRECCNCEYHLTKKANEEVIVRDEMLGKMREALTVAKEIIDTNLEIQRGCDPDYFLIRQALALPLPATTLRLEAERKVIRDLADWSKRWPKSQVSSMTMQKDCNDQLYEIEERAKSLANLDSLGGGK